ncbi:MAG: hypothetical protein HZA89_09615 [Verrucomicrobia bacterium]|nr:hypothetical protein [Verrucomicrobiota bacterium]
MNADNKWNRLAQCARQAPPAAVPDLPHGFATRVVARWLAGEGRPSLWAAWEWLSPRGLALAAVLMLASLGANYDLLGGSLADEVTAASSVLESLLDS